MSRRLSIVVCLCVVMLSAGGCVTVKQNDKRGTPVTKVQDASSNAAGKPVPDVVFPEPGATTGDPFYDQIDPCAARLHNLSGLLLKYYMAYRKFPNRLEEAAPLADPGQKLDFNCPLCNKQYVYLSPGGIGTAGQVLAYAPVPAKDGKYRAIKLRTASGSSLAALPDVVSMTPEEMKPFLSRAATP